MNPDNNIQHPDITAAERTGYPFPRKVEIEVTERLAWEYCSKQFDELWAFLLVAYPSTISAFLDSNHDDFNEFVVNI